MPDINSGLGWSEAQWAKVNTTVSEAFDKASVAAAFIPCYGPLQSSAEYVRNETLNIGPPVTVNDDTTLKLLNLTVHVELSSEQAADDSLSSALLPFRRAANMLAQAMDLIVFNGRGTGVSGGFTTPTALSTVAITGEADLQGLVSAATSAPGFSAVRSHRRGGVKAAAAATGLTKAQIVGEDLVSEVAEAVAELEDGSHPGPFACILGKDAFVAANTPATGLVLPADRITPLLNGPLLRSGQMNPKIGLVVSLSGGDIDLVIATPPKAQFLQMTTSARYLFRVYVKFMLRIKDASSVILFAI